MTVGQNSQIEQWTARLDELEIQADATQSQAAQIPKPIWAR